MAFLNLFLATRLLLIRYQILIQEVQQFSLVVFSRHQCLKKDNHTLCQILCLSNMHVVTSEKL